VRLHRLRGVERFSEHEFGRAVIEERNLVEQWEVFEHVVLVKYFEHEAEHCDLQYEAL
jgi:hypothetical protein